MVKRRNIANTMNFRRYIPDHAVTTVPVLALMFAVPYFLFHDDAVETGIELVDSASGYKDYWQRAGVKTEFDIDGEIERLELDEESDFLAACPEKDGKDEDECHAGYDDDLSAFACFHWSLW